MVFSSRISILKWEAYFLLPDSDIIHLNVAGTSLVVLDTSEAATELLERRSSIYSDRFSLVLLCHANIREHVLQSQDADDQRVDGLGLQFRFHGIWSVLWQCSMKNNP